MDRDHQWDCLEKIRTFLQEQAVLQPCCISKISGKDKQCNCLTIFEAEDEAIEYPLTRAVARYIHRSAP